MSRESSPRPRDASFLGLHASYDEELQDLDLYGTLREKSWSAELEWLLQVLRDARVALLAACPQTELPREPGLNPVLWSIGHVAFTFESLVADPLRLQLDGELDARTARADAWTLYDSMRVSNAERWAMSEASALPDREAVTRYLESVHQMAADAARVPLPCTLPARLLVQSQEVSTMASFGNAFPLNSAEGPSEWPPIHSCALSTSSSLAVLLAPPPRVSAQRALLPFSAALLFSAAGDCACEGRVPPVQSYLILYAIIHELWHAEDLVHSRHMQVIHAGRRWEGGERRWKAVEGGGRRWNTVVRGSLCCACLLPLFCRSQRPASPPRGRMPADVCTASTRRPGAAATRAADRRHR